MTKKTIEHCVIYKFDEALAKGKVLVFNSEGVQTNAKNAKFANRLQVA